MNKESGPLTAFAAAVLVFAPLFRGGNRPLPLLVLELSAVVLLAFSFSVRFPFTQQLSRPFLAVLAVLLAAPLLQIFPLNAGWWSALPDRGFYAEAGRVADVPGVWRTLSLVPTVTEAAWLALLPPVAVFVAVIGLPSSRIRTLVLVFLGVAAFEASLGLIQYGDGPHSVFRLGNAAYRDSATGTYVSRNHFGGMLEMALPLALALLVSNLGRGDRVHAHGTRRHHRAHGGAGAQLRERISALGMRRVNLTAVYTALSLVILLGIVFSRSRAAIALTILGLFACMLAFSRRVGGVNVYGLTGTVAVIGIALAAIVGLAPVWERFALQDPAEDSRWEIFSGTWEAIGHFFPLGSGFGTFPEVFPRFPGPLIDRFINHAHNDYLEWLMEGGALAALLMIAFLWFYLRQWSRVWVRGTWTSFQFLQVGAGIGLLLMILHGLVDFNLHIPANAIYTAFLGAVFFHRSRESHKPATDTLPAEGSKNIPHASAVPLTVPPENMINPFAD